MKMQNSPPIRMPSPPSHRGMRSTTSRPKKCAGAADATGAGVVAVTGAGAAAVTGAGAAAVIGAGVAAGTGAGAVATGVAATGADVTIEAGLRAGFPALTVSGPMHRALEPQGPKKPARAGFCLGASRHTQ